MLGAIIGDIVGSIYEWNNIKTKDFLLFSENSHFTDDSVMTIAIGNALLKTETSFDNLKSETINQMQYFGKLYNNAGYGGMFKNWLTSDNPQPYNSCGNGSAMRISAVPYFAKNLTEVKKLSKLVTEVTHNHPEGLKGAEATAVAIYLAKNKKSKEYIKKYIENHYYKLDKTIDEIRKTYEFKATCQETVPEALQAFLEATSFEDAIKNAVSIGGDSDTIAAITGSIAAEYFGIPKEIFNKALTYLTPDLKEVVNQFLNKKQINIILF